MFKKIEFLVEELFDNFDEIPVERKVLLNNLGNYLNEKIQAKKDIQLIYICTHNSRRSHFGQIAASLAASYFNIKKIKIFSGGTEVTCFNQNAINALQNLGFVIHTNDSNSINPIYNVAYNEHSFEECFSKVYNHKNNPKTNFAAIMTCSEAEQNCPLISGAEFRIGTTYKDPKIADNTNHTSQTYQERFKEIATEIMYAFSLVSQK